MDMDGLTWVLLGIAVICVIVLLEGRELCDACAGVTRTVPGGYVIEIHDTPLAVEVE